MTTFHYRVNGTQTTVQIEEEAHGYQVVIGDKRYRIARHNQEGSGITFSLDGALKQLFIAQGETSDERRLWFNGEVWTIEKIDPRRKNQRSSIQEESGALTTSMPGQVREILVKVGDSVQKGDPLVLLEAMKMEMRISAPSNGIVTALNCALGDVVERGQTVIVVSQESD